MIFDFISYLSLRLCMFLCTYLTEALLSLFQISAIFAFCVLLAAVTST